MSFTHAIQTLEQHPEADRIHKLLYWLYIGRWGNTPEELRGATVCQILPELIRRTPSYEVLEGRLYKAASALNKPEKYRQIATLILQTCQPLYPSLGLQADRVVSPESPSPVVQTISVAEEEALPMTAVLAQPDRFDLRQRVMQQVPPLKVKILLFSVLRRPFSFRSTDWKELNTQSLDLWLVELLQTFSSLDIIEKRLFDQAAELKRLDQGMQIADAIIQAVRVQFTVAHSLKAS